MYFINFQEYKASKAFCESDSCKLFNTAKVGPWETYSASLTLS